MSISTCCCSRASAKRGSFPFRGFTNADTWPVSSCKTRGQGVLWLTRLGMKKGVIYSLLLCLNLTSALWAGSFTNLNFESAKLVPIPGDPYSRVSFSAALPGWIGFSGTNQLDAAFYDNIFLDGTAAGIMDSSFHGFGGRILGNYTAFLEAGLSSFPDSGSADASLAQTGLVPSGTKSLSFFADSFGPFSVSLGGSNLNLISFPVANQNYSLYEADTSSYAGQTAQLQFTVFAQTPYNAQLHWLTLDSIQFSTQAIPEPGTFALTAAALMLLFAVRARRPRP